jgi:hypothetical protein
MARRRPVLAWAWPIRRDRFGRPVDPGYGVGEGGEVDQGLPEPEDELDPGYGVEGGARPGHGLPRPPWQRPTWPPTPIDPDWGIDVDTRPDHPVFIPGAPDNTLPLPPVEGAPTPPIANPPPGTIWPPLPPSAPEGKAAILVWIQGVGVRYVVVTIPPPIAGNLPGRAVPR